MLLQARQATVETPTITTSSLVNRRLGTSLLANHTKFHSAFSPAAPSQSHRDRLVNPEYEGGLPSLTTNPEASIPT